VIEKHAWAQGKKFLLITYYMIGAKDMESKILGEYVRQIERLHPGTPIPGVYRSEALFKDAEGYAPAWATSSSSPSSTREPRAKGIRLG